MGIEGAWCALTSISARLGEFWHGLTSADQIATCGVVIAALAMVTTVCEARATRRHNRLSVMPHLNTRTERTPGELVTLEIRNSGLGPAIIESVSYTLDGARLKSDGNGLPEAITDAFARRRVYCRVALPSCDTPMLPGDRECVLKFSDSMRSPEDRRKAEELLGRYGMIVHYRSIYGDRRTLRFDGADLPEVTHL